MWLCLGWQVTPIERTAYPQFKRLTSARVLADNDPAEQEKLIKLNTLLANL